MPDKQHPPRLKTMGPRVAQLITELNERERTVFTLADVASVTGLSPAACRNLAHKACRRGLATRLKPGLYNLVPFRMGRAAGFVDHPYLIAREMAGPDGYYLSHGTAFEIHRMVTQPVPTTHVSCTRRLRPQTVGGYRFGFTRVRDAQLFGTMSHWVDGGRRVVVSDPERTIIDGLRRPALLGGVTEVAKGLWMRDGAVNVGLLVEYAVRLGVGAVVRRLGYLLELYGMADTGALDTLRAPLTGAYRLLDPLMPNEGRYLSQWRLRLNVSPEELDAVRFG